jgi:hypothetical protein
MKVNPKITKQVNDSVAECREMIKNAIVILLKQIGAGNSDVVVFNRVLFLFQAKNNVSETILADRIMWGTGVDKVDYLITSLDDKFATTDCQLSLSNLQAIYDEVLNLVRNY